MQSPGSNPGFLTLIRHFTKLWPCYRTGPYYCLCHYLLLPYSGSFHRTFATGGAKQQRTPGLVPCGTCICSNVDTIFSFLNLGCLRTIWVSYIPRYFSFASQTNPLLIYQRRPIWHWEVEIIFTVHFSLWTRTYSLFKAKVNQQIHTILKLKHDIG